MGDVAVPETVVITGASGGIGAAAARALHGLGKRVVVVGRSLGRMTAVGRELGVPWHVADFARLADVRRLAGELLAAYPRIEVLANNAGYIGTRRVVTEDGHEMMFQVNHLAPFLLTQLLRERLVASGGRVIATSSIGNHVGHVDLGNLEHARGYRAFPVYCATKLQNVLFTRELARRWGPDGVAAAAFHPGFVATRFAGTDRGLVGLLYRTPLAYLGMVGAEAGADTLVWLALGRAGVDWRSGGYFARRRPGWVNAQADDVGLAGGLWEASAGMVGVGES